MGFCANVLSYMYAFGFMFSGFVFDIKSNRNLIFKVIYSHSILYIECLCVFFVLFCMVFALIEEFLVKFKFIMGDLWHEIDDLQPNCLC